MNNMEWKDIHGYKGIYQVSSTGIVKSLERHTKRNGHPKKVNERLLKQHLTHNGYPVVCLCKNGKSKMARVHQLVIMAFKGFSNKGLVVHHKDHNKLNNNINNLEYVSKQKNTQEYYKSIGKSKGVVPYEDIPKIIDAVNSGEKVSDIAEDYNVTRNDVATLCKIISLTGEELEIKS